MTDETQIADAFDSRVRRREERRDFFRAFGAAAAVGGGLALASCGGGDDDVAPTPSPTPTGTGTATATPTATPTPTPSNRFSDVDVLNFALNLEYLEAQFYLFAATGVGLPTTLLAGPTGTTPGAVTGGRKANLTDPVIANYAREIAQDERAHVEFLRNAIGATVIAQPAIDIGATATSAFSNAARAAGLIGAGAAFDPYANDENFLIAAYLFEDVGVTAYKGAAVEIASPVVLQAAAGILATEAYHAAMIRTALYTKGLIDATEAISTARDSLDGSSDLDQGVRPIGDRSNIAPLDANGIAFGRTPEQVLNIVYLNRLAVTTGGFFPAGVNGVIKTSAAN
ncbi:ferritin-like domain-containing protein [Sphingomonas sp. CFBP 13720]|uniref:ferritin-like domain-containing protein n=1 Tax=Sphingomonas sp. CFBP 13720 TaxID=2775302 RepID=UPI001781EF08|nr:ferritin-like domain-containing protein [Sphingomonas sp. CFBP 13720]MBD8679590.1 ferritin-like domain-containing protein [Sphingomonas sp. CFBP 13720]